MEELEITILQFAITLIGLGIGLILINFSVVHSERKWCPSAAHAKTCWDAEEERTANDPGQLRRTKWARGNYEFMMRHGLAKWGLFVFGLGSLLLILWFVFFR